MAEATIDELQIEIESDSSDASQSIEKLEQALQKLLAPVQALTTGSGLNKLTKQLEKLAEAGRAISGLSGFDKVAQASNALKSLDTLTGAPKVGSYVTALNKLSQAAAAVQTIATFPDITTQLMSLSNALNALRGVQDIRLTSLINGLSQLPAAVQAINSMPAIDVSRVEALNTAMEAFRTENAQQLKQLATALNRLPTVAQRINQIDFTQFANSIRQLTATLEPLMTRAEQAAQGLTALAQVMQAASRQSGGRNGVDDLSSSLSKLSLSSLVTWGTLVKLKNALAKCFDISAQYVENLNLFNVTMGDTAKTAFEFAEAVNSALGIDTSDWIRYQGFFQSVGKGFGVVSEKADLMSQNLTQLAYDISSFYNISSEEAYNKVQSGFAGELEPLRRLGFALDEATLKQLAYKKGITQTYESMTQAQKAQLRYVAMIEQAENIGVTGDMSRTIDTASNGVRVLQARIQQFARAIGNMLMPMLSAMLPYLTAFVQVLTDAANALANVFGFELPKIELGGISNGYDEVAAAASEATAATEKFKGSLAGVDQLNIIGSHSDKSGSGDGYSTDLDIKLPTYDFLNGVESKTKQIAEDMKEWFKGALPWIEAVAAAIGSVFLTTSIVTFGSKLEGIVTTIIKFNAALGDVGAKKFWGATGGLMAGSASGILLFNSLKKISSGAKATANDIVQLASGFVIAGGAIAAFIALGNPLGAVITGIGAAVGIVVGLISGVNEKIAEQNKAITDSVLYNNGGTKISAIADAFSDWADSAAAVNRQTIEKYQALDEYNTKLEQTLDTMEDIVGTDIDFTKLEPADAEVLKEPFNELCDYLNDEFQARARTAADDLKEIFENLGISGVIEEQVTQGYDRLQSLFSENLTETQRVVAEYLDKIATGGTLSETQMADFKNRYSMATELAREGDENWRATQDAFKRLEGMDLTNLDLESEESALSAISEIKQAAAAYEQSYQQRRTEEMENLDSLQRQLDIMYSHGSVTKAQYDEQSQLLQESKEWFDLNYAMSMDALSKQMQKILDNSAGTVHTAAQKVLPNFWQGTVALGATGLLGLFTGDTKDLSRDIAISDYTNNSPILAAIDEAKAELNEMQANINVELSGQPAALALAAGLGEGSMSANVTLHVDSEFETAENTAAEIYAMAINSDSAPAWGAAGAARTGYARDAISETISEDELVRAVIRGMNESGGGMMVNVTNTFEMDGDVLAEAAFRQQANAVYVTGGR